jgi:glycosyltransferase involved in cell wall biosynthesis
VTARMPPPCHVSLVIPMFNNAAHVAEAIDSALAQTHPLREILVVDDGSTDDSVAIAERFGPPVQVFRQEHAGQGAGRNTGAARARGDLLAFLDADDVWLPEKIALQVAALAANESCDMAFGRIEQFFSPELGHAGGRPRVLGSAEQRGLLPGALLVRTSAFRRVGGFREDVTFGEFVDWYIRANEAGLSACTVDEVVLRRRLHATNAGVRERAKRREYAKVLKDMLDRRAAAENDESSTARHT